MKHYSGRLFGCGYNDRGQLGLGHRINTFEFVLVESLAHKFVVQVRIILLCGI
jgi:hypothetical protein